ncbi:hypothetical protein MMC28_000481 [Mycoblastus sanguinarius]|nr:hypothetical protein [Mycoblastus sanguinarius]
MAAPSPAMAIPREIIDQTTTLEHKPGASVHYSFVRSDQSPVLVVFVNGLMSDKATWIPVMAGIIRQRKGTAASGFPSMLAYDRYGQGMTEDRDPQDQGRERGHGHDCKDAAEDVHYLVEHFAKGGMGVDLERVHIVMVANSIGCAIARLYAQTYPVAAILFLDSIIANSDFDFWPDPDADGFDAGQLPDDVTVEELRKQRVKFAVTFRPEVINKEGLSRRSLAKLLPESDQPVLGTEGDGPWVTVIGHDFQTFADESIRTMDTPIGLSMKYSNPIWNKYNEGLARITNQSRSKGPIQAKGCGHFIQRDDPNLVIDETLHLVDKVRMQKSAMW